MTTTMLTTTISEEHSTDTDGADDEEQIKVKLKNPNINKQTKQSHLPAMAVEERQGSYYYVSHELKYIYVGANEFS